MAKKANVSKMTVSRVINHPDLVTDELKELVHNVMKELGYKHVKIPTQTNTWLACKVYLDLGFLPVPENAVHSSFGWRIIKTLSCHPALSGFEPITQDEIIADQEEG